MRHNHVLGSLVISLISLSFVSCGRGSQGQSGLDTVDIPQTDIRNQEKVGFCWAYATVAFIESNYKTRTGQEVKLSPEAIGFYRMARGLYQATRAKSLNDILPLFVPGGLEGYFVKLQDGGDDALSLIDKYGVVPESEWAIKFDTDTKSREVTRAMQSALWVLVRDRFLRGKDATDLTMDDIFDKVMTAKGAFPSKPPTSFQVQGVTMSATDYLRDVLQFKSSDYVAVRINNATDFARFIQGSKRALVRGVAVPLAYPVNVSLLQGDTFSGKGADSATNYAKDGAHAVLITDFVNAGKSTGAMTPSEITEELKRPIAELDHFVIKNSWGKSAKKNESGKVIRGSETGYYKIDREYLEGSSAQALNKESMRNLFSVMLPVDIANAPFDDEPVNTTISKK